MAPRNALSLAASENHCSRHSCFQSEATVECDRWCPNMPVWRQCRCRTVPPSLTWLDFNQLTPHAHPVYEATGALSTSTGTMRCPPALLSFKGLKR